MSPLRSLGDLIPCRGGHERGCQIKLLQRGAVCKVGTCFILQVRRIRLADGATLKMNAMHNAVMHDRVERVEG